MPIKKGSATKRAGKYLKKKVLSLADILNRGEDISKQGKVLKATESFLLKTGETKKRARSRSVGASKKKR